MKNIKIILTFMILFVLSSAVFAKFQTLDGTTRETFTVGGFPIPGFRVVNSVSFPNGTGVGSAISSATSVDTDLAMFTPGFSTGASKSGDVIVISGNNSGTNTGDTGLALFQTGNNTGTGSSGLIRLSTGVTTDAAAASGILNFLSGNSVFDSGAITVKTGNSSADDSGDITVETGTAAGTRGDVNIDANSVNIFAPLVVAGDLLPDATAIRDIGSTVLLWDGIFGRTLELGGDGLDGLITLEESGGGKRASIVASGQMNDGSAQAVGAGFSSSAKPFDMGLSTAQNILADADETGDIFVRTGEQNNGGGSGKSGLIELSSGDVIGSGDSGDIDFITGTAGGTRGNITVDANFLIIKNAFVPNIADAHPIGSSTLPFLQGFFNQLRVGRGSGDAGIVELSTTSGAGKLSMDVATVMSNGSNRTVDVRYRTITTGGNLGYETTVQSGPAATDTGSQFMETGNVSTGAGTAKSGLLSFLTGSNAGSNDSGEITLETGDQSGASGDSGAITLETGTSANGTRGDVTIDGNTLVVASDILPDADNTRTIGSNTLTYNEIFVDNVTSASPLNIQSEDETSGSSTGDVTMKSGENGGAGNTGFMNIQTGDQTGTGTASGDINLVTGTVDDVAAVSGSISIETGNTAGGDRGDIIMTGKTLDLTGMGNITLPVGAGVANDTLSNLVSPVAFNQDLLPDGDETRSIGSTSNRILNILVNKLISNEEINLTDNSSNTFLAMEKGQTLPSGAGTVDALKTGSDTVGAALGIGIFTSDNDNADGITNKGIFLETGPKSNAAATAGSGALGLLTGDAGGASGDSGDITLETGTSANGTRGDVTIDGNTLIVASDILPDADNTRTIGSNSLTYNEIFVDNVTSASPLNIQSEDETSGSSTGDVTMKSGENGGAGNTGFMNIQTGDQTGTGTASGDINLVTGSVDDVAAVSGSISIETGTTAGGDRGDIILTGKTLDLTGMTDITLPATSGVANDTLSNLVSPTSINQDLLPSATNVRDLGDTTTYWDFGFIRELSTRLQLLRNSALTAIGSIASNASSTLPSGDSVDLALAIEIGNSGAAFYSKNDGTGDANPTSFISLETGNKTAGTGDSGDIKIQTGTSVGGSRGDVTIKGDSLIVSSDILPDTNNSRMIGSSALTYSDAFVNNMTASSGMTIQTEDEVSGSATNDINFKTGENGGAGNTGFMNILTGDQTGTGTASGDINIITGTVDDVAALSGSIFIETGNTAGGDRGGITMTGKDLDISGMVSLTGAADFLDGVGLEVISEQLAVDLEAAGAGAGGLEFVGNEVAVDAGPGIELTATGVEQIGIYGSTFASPTANNGVRVDRSGGTATTVLGIFNTSLGAETVVFGSFDLGEPVMATSLVSASGTTTGQLLLTSGENTSNGQTGNVNLASGEVVNGISGTAILNTGRTTTGASGNITVNTGPASGVGGTSGNISVQSGTTTTGLSGKVDIVTASPSAGGISGLILVASGDTTTSATGVVTVESGTASAANGTSGDVTVQSGGANDSATGAVKLISGNSAGATGDITSTTGNSSAGASGEVILTTGTSSTVANRGIISMSARHVDITVALKTVQVTADPCGVTSTFPEGSIFYNNTSDYYCFCTGAGVDVQMHAPATDCF